MYRKVLYFLIEFASQVHISSGGGNENSEMLHNRSNKISEMPATQVFQQRFLAYA